MCPGADIVGVNCRFGPTKSLETCRLMKAALDGAGLHPFLMAQPVGYHTPDVGREGFAALPELPLGEWDWSNNIIHPIPSLINLKIFPEPHQKYNITQYKERGFSQLTHR